MTRHIAINSAKGGQGVTTTCLLLANSYAADGKKVLLVDDPKHGDIAAAVGIGYEVHHSFPYQLDKKGNVWWAPASHVEAWDFEKKLKEYDVVIWDDCIPDKNEYELYLVTECCYIALRKLVNIDHTRAPWKGVTPSGVIVVQDNNRALSSKDVAYIAQSPVVLVIPYDPAISRKIDAGVAYMLPNTYIIKEPVH